MQSYQWYSQLIKPDWAPPAWLFAPAWTFLYTIIAISFGYVVYRVFKHKLPKAILIPFALNLVFNFAFTPIAFGLQNLPLASIDVVLVLVTLVWSMLVIRRRVKWVALVNIPYLLWVTFASTLQLTITFLNR
jgi:tryptophan-rich sensory protein